MKNSILITGGSRGIGAATALLAAQRGYQVCINYANNKSAADKVVDHINQNGGNSIAVQADISQENEVIDLFNFLDKHFGPLNALVNNAGILNNQMQVVMMDTQRLQRIFGVNVIGSFLCAREAIKR